MNLVLPDDLRLVDGGGIAGGEGDIVVVAVDGDLLRVRRHVQNFDDIPGLRPVDSLLHGFKHARAVFRYGIGHREKRKAAQKHDATGCQQRSFAY